MLTRGSGSPTCVSRNHDQAPASECSTGQYSSERKGVGGDFGVIAWIVIRRHIFANWTGGCGHRFLTLVRWPIRAIACLLGLVGVNIASRHQILLALMGNAVYES
jgi:hypothetical protein